MKKLTEKELEVFNCVKENGGKISIAEMAARLGRTDRSVSMNVTGLAGEKKGCLLQREKVEVEESEKPIAYAVLTEAGKTFDPATAEYDD